MKKETSVTQLQRLDMILDFVPSDMYSKRMKMKPAKKGFVAGVRGAAKEIGISPTTYQRAEAGDVVDIKTLRKILKWTESEVTNVQ